MTEGEQLQARRAPNKALQTLRAVRKVARPYQIKLDIWQAQLAGLRVRRMMGLGLDLACEEAERLSPLASAARVELARDADEAGFVVGEHSVLRDLDRALLRLIETADELIENKTPRAS